MIPDAGTTGPLPGRKAAHPRFSASNHSTTKNPGTSEVAGKDSSIPAISTWNPAGGEGRSLRHVPASRGAEFHSCDGFLNPFQVFMLQVFNVLSLMALQHYYVIFSSAWRLQKSAAPKSPLLGKPCALVLAPCVIAHLTETRPTN